MPESWLNKNVRRALFWVASNPVSAIGGVLAGGGLILTALFILVFMASGDMMNPYYGALGFLGLPMLISLGAAIIGIGKFIFRNRDERPFWIEQFNIKNEKKALTVFLGTTGGFVFLLGLGGMQSSKFMNSARFCGQTCHSVMEPEAVAHANSAHSGINCVNCHVGEGAKGLLVSKIRGSWQIISLMTNHYQRPIPTPVETLPSSEDTCQNCHNTANSHPSRMKLYPSFKDDRENSRLVSAVIMNIGSSKEGEARGIHAHSSASLKVRYYATDAKRSRISWVEAKTGSGTRTWTLDGESPPDIQVVKKTSKGRPVYILNGSGEVREMDCVDCHNRVGHNFKNAEEVADGLIAAGKIDRSAPYAKRTALRALHVAADGHKETFAEKMNTELAASLPPSGERELMAAMLAAEAKKYLYPHMNIRWGAYENMGRHARDQGCFRCHNQRMKDGEGNHINQDCDYCHKMVADRMPYEEFEKRLFPPPPKEGTGLKNE